MFTKQCPENREWLSVNYASTFPGFCQEHEAVFSEYERRKNLSTDNDIGLQIFRTITRELFIINHYLSCLKEELNKYIKFRNQRFKEIFEEEIRNNKIPDVGIVDITFKNADTYEILCTQEIDELFNRLQTVEEFYSRMHNILYKHDSYNTISSLVINIDIIIPVALSGMGNYGIIQNDKSSNVVCMLNVIPQEKNTLLIITVLEEYEESVKFYINKFGENGYISYKNFIEMIESWMTHGTDNWFINPSVWYEIDDFNKKQILSEIEDTSKNISDKFTGDIFKKLKLYVELMEMKNKQMTKDDNLVKLES